MDDFRRKAGCGAAFLALILMIAAPCAAQSGPGGAATRSQAPPIRVIPSLVIPSVVVREQLEARADGVQPASVAPPKADKQGKGALIGAGIGFFAGLIFATSHGRSEGDGPLILAIAALATVVGMSIGASVSL
ncbi:MAG: hypothetical protein ABIR59_11895 [Gemmatimonadales bacterium]